ncbi:MAG: alpha/beta hydrolase [Candidatus Binatus sp.]|uniref:alpha/beta fold hydrolase n=1 Tax=Candidatus Binatus sp. TaxID=2811406 RepID=UPI002717EC72|nr:alpha/beta hydrolase [Candidatus Binatus sp.]MDO8431352.1 alpha/beta hydrolase [Candidatus Binatus sp.]
MPKIQVGDIDLNYDVYGAGEPILMIMGLGASSAQWDPELVQDLARTFRVITFDNRGTGQSDKPDAPYSIEMFADDAAGLLAKLEISRAHIFGVSMGGMIAQEFALRHPAPTATLTLGCTTAGGTHSVPPPPESLKILTAPREGVSPEEVIRRGWPLGYTAKYIAQHRDLLEAAIPRVLKYPTPPYAFQRQLEGTYTLKTFDRLPQIKAPTLVVTGAEDVLIPAKNSEIIAAQIPGAKLHIIPGVGHAFMSEGRETFVEVFVPFVKSHPMRA